MDTLAHFNVLKFYLSTTAGDGDTLISTNDVYLIYPTVDLGIDGDHSPLQIGDRIILVKSIISTSIVVPPLNANGSTMNAPASPAGAVMQGYVFAVAQEENLPPPASSSEKWLVATVTATPSPAFLERSIQSATSAGAKFSLRSSRSGRACWTSVPAANSCPGAAEIAGNDPAACPGILAGKEFTDSVIGPEPGAEYRLCFVIASDVGKTGGPKYSTVWENATFTMPGGQTPTPPPPSGNNTFSDGDTLVPGKSYVAPAGNPGFCLEAPGSAPVTVQVDNVPYTIAPRAENTCFEIFSTGIADGRTLILASGIGDISSTNPGVALLMARNGDLVWNTGNATIRASLYPACTSTRVSVLQGEASVPAWLRSPFPATGCPDDALTPGQGSYMFSGAPACNSSALKLKGTYAKLTVKHTQNLAAGQQYFTVAGHPVYGWYQNNTAGWMPLDDPFLPLFTATQTGPQTLTLVDSLDISGIPGIELYAGYGADVDEMMMNGRYCGVFKVAP